MAEHQHPGGYASGDVPREQMSPPPASATSRKSTSEPDHTAEVSRLRALAHKCTQRAHECTTGEGVAWCLAAAILADQRADQIDAKHADQRTGGTA